MGFVTIRSDKFGRFVSIVIGSKLPDGHYLPIILCKIFAYNRVFRLSKCSL